MKKPNPNPDADLKLLLTDYSVRRRSLLTPAAPSGKAGERGRRLAATPAGPRHNLHLLVEDFPLRAKDWWEVSTPRSRPACRANSTAIDRNSSLELFVLMHES